VKIVFVVGEFTVSVSLLNNGNGNFTSGENMTLQCNVTGDITDDVYITWSKDGFPLENDDHYHTNVSSGELNVLNMSTDHSGEYICTAKRDYQMARNSLIVKVQGLACFLNLFHQVT
jgi:hypothetical protein